MFQDSEPNVVILGDSNTWAFGPAWVSTLVNKGWPSDQVIWSYRSGTTPRHWLPKWHRRHQGKYGVLIDRKSQGGGPAVHDALSPNTALVIIGLGGNMIPGTRGNASVDDLIALVDLMAPHARILWRGPPPSTASKGGQVANRPTRAGRYRRNGMLKQRLAALGFEVLGERARAADRRLYLDVLALHATGPAPGVRPLATGRDQDLEAEQTLLDSLRNDSYARNEAATRGPWDSFVRGRDSMPSHVPKGDAADFVDIVAKRKALEIRGKCIELPARATVVDGKALLRGEGPRHRPIGGEVLPKGQAVLLETWEGRYGQVLDARTKAPLGWTARSNLKLS